jgi:hypothetical protein
MDYCISMLFGVFENKRQIEEVLIMSMPSFESDELLRQGLDNIISDARKHVEQKFAAEVSLIALSTVKL